jgi:hypothetical protein
MPEGPQERLAAGWINAANGALGGIAFPPHITLMGGLLPGPLGMAPFAAIGMALAGGIPAFDTKMTRVIPGETHFQRLTIEAEMNPVLAQARESAESLLKHGGSSPFSPHLSLYYGDGLPDPLPGLFSAIDEELPVTVKIQRLVLARTTGPVDQWVLHRSWALHV